MPDTTGSGGGLAHTQALFSGPSRKLSVTEQRGKRRAGNGRGGPKLAAKGCLSQPWREGLWPGQCEGTPEGDRQPDRWAGPNHRALESGLSHCRLWVRFGFLLSRRASG